MLYEYRQYFALPGKMRDLNNRFRDHTTRLWKAHGFKEVGFFEAQFGETNVLHYVLQWDSAEQRQQSWASFMSDPAWIEARTKSEEQGPLVAKVRNELWAPTDYSPKAQQGLV
jgi:NIPSNAP